MLMALMLSVMMQAPASPAVPPADPPSEAWGGFATGAAQLGTGLAVCVVCSPILLCPGWGGCIHNVLVGIAVGASEPMVGDWLGAKRGTLLWPMITAIGTGAVTGITSVIVAVALGSSADFGVDPTVALSGVLLAPALIGLFGGGLIALLPMLVYQFGAVDKMSGDHGEGFPGILTPADPTGTRDVPPAAPPVAEPQPTPEPIADEPAAPEVGPSVGY
jgi:hypothetical protein